MAIRQRFEDGEESAFEIEDQFEDLSHLSDDDDEDFVPPKEKGDKRKWVVLGGAAAIAAVLGLSATVLFSPLGGNQLFGEGTSDGGGKAVNTTQTQSGSNPSDGGGSPDVPSKQEWWEKPENRFPVKTEKWEEEAYSQDSFKSNKKEIVKSRSQTSLSTVSNQLPSESLGFTSEPKKEFNSDGTLNPMYSFWTAEDFQSESHSYIERLLNPVYGGWELYQYPAYPGNEYYDNSIFSDMFTDSLNEEIENAANPSDAVPIYADWSGDNYGGNNNLLESGSRWFGEVNSEDVAMDFDDDTQQYVVKYKANVTFTAWSKDQTKQEKGGVLEITFVANNGSNKSTHKVLIDKAKLTMDGE